MGRVHCGVKVQSGSKVRLHDLFSSRAVPRHVTSRHAASIRGTPLATARIASSILADFVFVIFERRRARYRQQCHNLSFFSSELFSSPFFSLSLLLPVCTYTRRHFLECTLVPGTAFVSETYDIVVDAPFRKRNNGEPFARVLHSIRVKDVMLCSTVTPLDAARVNRTF